MSLVFVKKRIKNGKPYYYLNHHSGSKSLEQYIGTTIPENIIQIKREFLFRFYREIWSGNLESIKKAHTFYLKKIPKSVLDQNLIEFSYHFTYDSQKIEGSSLTQQDTYNLLRFKLTPGKKPQEDMIEAQKHHELFLKIISDDKMITRKSILDWHRNLFESTKPDIAGKIREYPVYITNSKSAFPHFKFVPKLLDEFFRWYNKEGQTMQPVELAGLAHFRFVNIHPFGDGNGRISRLIMNKILYAGKFPLLDIKFAERKFYFKALEKGNLKAEEMYFLKWFIKKYFSENKKYLK